MRGRGPIASPRPPPGDGEAYDDLDDGTDTLAGYRSVLHGPTPKFTPYPTWHDELDGLVHTIQTWRDELITDEHGVARDHRGLIAICVAEHNRVDETASFLAARAGISCAELTKDGPPNAGEAHIGTMHRFKGLEYQKIAIA